MKTPARVTKGEAEAVIAAAKAAGAKRVKFDYGRIIVEFSESEAEDPLDGFTFDDEEDSHDEAA